MKVEKIVLNEAREVSLTAYLLDTGEIGRAHV